MPTSIHNHNNAHVYAPPPLTPLPVPTIRASGPPSQVMDDCPESQPITCSLTWYRFPTAPDFWICSACYLKHIAHSPHASDVERIQRPDNSISICRFWVSRVVDILWPQVLRTGNRRALELYAARRRMIADCAGTSGVGAEARVRWYAPLDPHWQPAGFIACEACFEDRVMGTAFEGRWGPFSRRQEAGQTWSCDLCNEYIARAANEFGAKGRGGSDSWHLFRTAVARRMQVPTCEGRPLSASTATWWAPKRRIKDLVACEMCYLDQIALTEFDGEFERTYGAQEQRWYCDLAAGSMTVAMAVARTKHDYSIFHNAASTIMYAPPCSPQNNDGQGRWYTLASGGGFSVCEACHAGYAVPFGLGPHFVPHSPSRGCSFNPFHPHSGVLRDALTQVFITGILTPLANAARNLPTNSAASIPPASHTAVSSSSATHVAPCRGAELVTDGTWYGFADALFCAACYSSFAAGSTLDAALTVRNVRDARPFLCSLYSPRMRALWSASPPGDPSAFIAAARDRTKAFVAVQQAKKNLEALKLAKYRMAMHQGSMALRYQGMAGMAELTGTGDGHAYRHGGGNWHATWQGAESDRLMDGMRAGFADVARGDETRQIVQLEMRWKAVE
ncbi:hypothetical protein B0H16DRAFT_541796 [Mycena metata]|uniref:Integral membrane protein n=1 Tax=Mycena metata TaxID=1033252 RepID=A0AAD7MEW5_9AGAR|nr:hypothetical protein B0H16DRAFT_541796 [Mycena metata]